MGHERHKILILKRGRKGVNFLRKIHSQQIIKKRDDETQQLNFKKEVGNKVQFTVEYLMVIGKFPRKTQSYS